MIQDTVSTHPLVLNRSGSSTPHVIATAHVGLSADPGALTQSLYFYDNAAGVVANDYVSLCAAVADTSALGDMIGSYSLALNIGDKAKLAFAFLAYVDGASELSSGDTLNLTGNMVIVPSNVMNMSGSCQVSSVGSFNYDSTASVDGNIRTLVAGICVKANGTTGSVLGQASLRLNTKRLSYLTPGG